MSLHRMENPHPSFRSASFQAFRAIRSFGNGMFLMAGGIRNVPSAVFQQMTRDAPDGTVQMPRRTPVESPTFWAGTPKRSRSDKCKFVRGVPSSAASNCPGCN